MLTTPQARIAWAPHCTRTKQSLHGAYSALDDCLQAHGYRPRSGVTGAQNCRPITGGTAYSLHAYAFDVIFTFWSGVRIAMALAVDINWDKNPYGPRLITDMPRGMIDDIYRIRTNNGKQIWRWGGYYANNKDAMHFEIVCTPADLATGIDPATLPGARPAPPTPTPDPGDDDDMAQTVPYWLIQIAGDPRVWKLDAAYQNKQHVRDETELKALQFVRGLLGHDANVSITNPGDPLAVIVDRAKDVQDDRIIWYKGPAEDPGPHPYRVTGIFGKHLSDASHGLVAFLSMPEGNARETAFDAAWQGSAILIDGPCRNTPDDVAETVAAVVEALPDADADPASVAAVLAALEQSGLLGLLPGK